MAAACALLCALWVLGWKSLVLGIVALKTYVACLLRVNGSVVLGA